LNGAAAKRCLLATAVPILDHVGTLARNRALRVSEFVNIQGFRAAQSLRHETGFPGGQVWRFWISGAELKSI
jgi:type IV secretory pathway protease TraF